MSDFFTLKLKDDELVFLDQTSLPLNEIYVVTDDYNRIAEAIERLEIRGAPAIGVAAAYAVALGMKKVEMNIPEQFIKVHDRLAKTRPTAVNLFWALDKMKEKFYEYKGEDIYHNLIKTAIDIHNDDIDKCKRLAQNGLHLFNKKINVLTHCNTGKLATGGDGTALAVIKEAFKQDFIEMVFADETRPLFQGSRLTAFELDKAGIPFKVITDSTAAFVMQKKLVDLVIVGADRIALNGDAANKIGTYNLAVLCDYHKIPFYIAAPTSTIDKNIKDGSQIIIEERNKNEIFQLNGRNISSQTYDAYCPSFDVTPNHLISGIITETGVFRSPFNL